MDRLLGADHATFVSGYEGSPLAGFDMELQRHRALLEEHQITHLPALNEELAATAVCGSQLARTVAELQVRRRHRLLVRQGAGPRPGHRCASATPTSAAPTRWAARSRSSATTRPHKSSSIPCSSEYALADLMMPTLFPADPAQGRRVRAARRRAVPGERAVDRAQGQHRRRGRRRRRPIEPRHFVAARPDRAAHRAGAYQHKPTAHLLGHDLVELETSLHRTRLPIAVEYIRRSGLNKIRGAREAQIGLVAAGLDLPRAAPGAHHARPRRGELERRGIRLLKLGVIYPLEPSVVVEFAQGLEQIVVVEDKRAFIEDALKSILYGRPDVPQVVRASGAADGTMLFSGLGELDSDAIASDARTAAGPRRHPGHRSATAAHLPAARRIVAPAVLLLRLPAQLLDPGRAGRTRRWRHRLPHHAAAHAGRPRR